MRRATLPILLFVVAGLFLLWRAREREFAAETAHAYDHALWPSAAPERVFSVRIDNLERGAALKLERDARGSWFLTDPIAYPAQDELVLSLLATLARSRGLLEANADPKQLSLDPPLVVVETVEVAEDGEGTLRRRMEVGAVDVDLSRIHVRVPGHPAGTGGAAVFRAPRTIYTTLDRNVDDFRDTRATHLRGREVISFRRSGSFESEATGVVELGLDAEIVGTAWARTDGARVALDPSAIGVLARCAAELRLDGFLDDAPRDYQVYGLDPPTLRVELADERGERVVLLFGFAERYRNQGWKKIRWLARREGFAHVWEVDREDVRLLMRPADALLDYQIVRVRRDDVVRVELERDGRTLLLERTGSTWRVSERNDGTDAVATPELFPADAGGVEDLLAFFEQAQIGEFLPGVPLTGRVAPDDGASLSFTLQTQAGERFGGVVGAAWRDVERGAAGHLLLRFGDELVGLVSDELVERCRTELATLRSRVVHRYEETAVRAVRLSHDDHDLDYVRLDSQWYPFGVRIPAPVEVPLLIERLISLRADEWIDGGVPVELLDSRVQVHLDGTFGKTLFLLGRRADGKVVCRTEPGRCALVAPELLADALALFGP